jgi:carboxyl-terminal processing protease
MYYADFFRPLTPDSYKYIALNFKDIQEWTDLYDWLQILVYHNLLNNTSTRILKNKNMNAYVFYKYSDQILWINSLKWKNALPLRKINATKNDFKIIKDIFYKEISLIKKRKSENDIQSKKVILDDVFNTLTTQHYDKDTTSKVDLINKAIEWLAQWTWDKHTTYFPPVKNENFLQWLSWEFEWIGAYVEMETPWVFKIVSPITGSPAYKAGLKWWDIVTKVDNKEITKDVSSSEVISWIKWPKWTKVTLTINRKWKIFDLDVIRDKIIIKDIETELINRYTFYINISNFWPHVSNEYKKALEELKENKYVNKIIIDVRNNGGWYLDQVTDMLSYMVPEWENTAIIKYLEWNKTYKSAWYELIDFGKYKIVVLQNSWTASASEILAGTIKDYYPESTSIWEQSYGKWSVQKLKQYKDWSLLKYTVARWYTWWTETSISWVGLTPDIKLELDMERYKKYNTDNQLDKALKTR